MSISIEQLQAIQAQQAQQTDTRKKSAPAPGEGFDSLLSSQISEQTAIMTGLPTPPPGSRMGVAGRANSMLLGNEAEAESAEDSQLGSVANGVDKLLSGFETYATRLADGSSGSLKAAHSLLQDLSQSVKTLRLDNMELTKANPSMDTILNELDVIATTERFKFNRGDYI